MSSSNDRNHFDDYREQTAVKHEILAAYLPAYFHILKSGNNNLLLIDGFAGRGTYTDAAGRAIDGSPLRALKLIAETPAFHSKVSTIFVESDDILFPQLKEAVDNFYSQHQSIRSPLCLHATFAECVNEVLTRVNGNLAPTFLFVDPCGVSGTSLHAIKAVMDCDKCEAFIFFNIDGVRRTAGLEKLSHVLTDLMGSEERAKKLYDGLRKTADSSQREALILSEYRAALKEIVGANYIIPFRVEHEDKQKTSHYLIHVTKHPLGFRIMKDVMWKRGRDENRAGGLLFAQSSRTNYIPLFDNRGDTKREILDALRTGPLRVSVFYERWSERPDDTLCESAYREALLELESAGNIEVLNKDCKNVISALARKKWRGKPTLAEDYYVRLPKADA
ncbi:MAG TPA: three-Cys-motif partner protein TcmP [Tepidisphaeraceae bacterium]|nr:three-Cys-motif partner protein TcmP [Tepidisphaeraceae bacterium]